MRFLTTLLGGTEDTPAPERFAHVGLHPTVDAGLPEPSEDFVGSAFRCRCAEDQVVIEVAAQATQSRLCGCMQCWKPEDALFSWIVAVPHDSVTIMVNEDKLEVVDPSLPMHRHACSACGVHLYGRFEDPKHPFHDLCFVHPEIADVAGWTPPTHASYVSSLIETGIAPARMAEIRGRLTEIGVPPHDCLSPDLMDAVAIHRARQHGTLP